MKQHSIKKLYFITCAALVVLFLKLPISASEQIHDQYSDDRDKVFASTVLFKDNNNGVKSAVDP